MEGIWNPFEQEWESLWNYYRGVEVWTVTRPRPGFGTHTPGPKSWTYSALAVWPRECYQTSLFLIFFFCKVKSVPSQVSCEDTMRWGFPHRMVVKMHEVSFNSEATFTGRQFCPCVAPSRHSVRRHEWKMPAFTAFSMEPQTTGRFLKAISLRAMLIKTAQKGEIMDPPPCQLTQLVLKLFLVISV